MADATAANMHHTSPIIKRNNYVELPWNNGKAEGEGDKKKKISVIDAALITYDNLMRIGRTFIIVKVKTKIQIIFPFSEITTQNNENNSSFKRENREIWRLIVTATISMCIVEVTTKRQNLSFFQNRLLKRPLKPRILVDSRLENQRM